jgi:hypothetical protein
MVTFAELFQFVLLLIAFADLGVQIISLIFQIHKSKKK